MESPYILKEINGELVKCPVEKVKLSSYDEVETPVSLVFE